MWFTHATAYENVRPCVWIVNLRPNVLISLGRNYNVKYLLFEKVRIRWIVSIKMLKCYYIWQILEKPIIDNLKTFLFQLISFFFFVGKFCFIVKLVLRFQSKFIQVRQTDSSCEYKHFYQNNRLLQVLDSPIKLRTSKWY